MSTDLPIVVEIVDAREKIDALLPHLQTMVQEGMITMEYVMILMYRHNKDDAAQPAEQAMAEQEAEQAGAQDRIKDEELRRLLENLPDEDLGRYKM